MLTEQQLLDRRNYIGGSDSAVICGISPWNTPLQLWMEKTGRVEPEDISHANHIKFGNYFEDGVAQWFMAESGLKVERHDELIKHPQYEWMAGNIDRRVVGENAILECKTALHDSGWGSGENLIPTYYLTQVAHYCAVGGFDKAYIAVVFATTREMRWYTYDRTKSFEEKLIAREKNFWENFVLADVAPEATNVDDLMLLYKEANATPIVADDSVDMWIGRLKDVKKKIKDYKEDEKSIAEKIKLYMKDHDTLLDRAGNPIATWRFTKPIKHFDKDGLQKKEPEIYAKYCTEKDPERRLNLMGDKE